MKVTKKSWFFRLLGLLAFALVFGMMFTGCGLITIGGGILLGGGIGSTFTPHKPFGLGSIIGMIIGGIIGIIIYVNFLNRSSGSSSSSNSSSRSSDMSSSIRDSVRSRENSPHTCYNCNNYSLTKKECRLNGNSMSAENSCSNWC